LILLVQIYKTYIFCNSIMLVFVLDAFCWTKSLLCNDAFKQGFSYLEFF